VSKFATIQVVRRFRKVTYYTVTLQGNPDSLFGQFLKGHTTTHSASLQMLNNLIQKIGNDYGAEEHWFRHEAWRGGDARALPGKAKAFSDFPLRLYCFRVSSSAVVLFSGAEKTAQRAQDCPNVRDHFYLANALSEAFDLALKNQDRLWINKNGELEWEEGFKLNFRL
jgi:hypothetical protein